MKPDAPLPDRLKAGSPALGEAANTDIERRAAELAHCDGRASFTDADLSRAAAELAAASAPPPAPEAADPSLAQVTAWDDPVGQAGHRIVRAQPEDEASIDERLVLDGLEEADHDIRTAAEDKS